MMGKNYKEDWQLWFMLVNGITTVSDATDYEGNRCEGDIPFMDHLENELNKIEGTNEKIDFLDWLENEIQKDELRSDQLKVINPDKKSYEDKIRTIEVLKKSYELELLDLKKSKRAETNPNLSLVDIADDNFEELIDRLIKNGYIHNETHTWIKAKETYKTLISFIKILHSEGKINRQLSNNEIKLIVQNTFKTNVGQDTIKRAKADKYLFDKLYQ